MRDRANDIESLCGCPLPPSILPSLPRPSTMAIPRISSCFAPFRLSVNQLAWTIDWLFEWPIWEMTQ